MSVKRLLLIDDDIDDCELFIEAVKDVDETIVCTTAHNGQMAIDWLNNNLNELPDFIFLDLRMPRKGGKACLAELKNNQRFSNIPVIIYTTSKSLEESKELIEMGACHFMTKPRNADDIYYMVSLVLEEQWNSSPKAS